MKKLFVIVCCFLACGFCYVESVYTYSVPTIEGNIKPISTYAGKKILVVALPTIQNSVNDSLLHSLDSLGAAYSGTLVIIASPSYEDGFMPANKTALKTWYRSILGSGVIITDGLYTRKTSGGLQHPLFKWLTDKDMNVHFNQDVTGPWNKFLIAADGRLVGVLAAPARLNGAVLNKFLQGQ
jgi:glutathione peroxidase